MASQTEIGTQILKIANNPGGKSADAEKILTIVRDRVETLSPVEEMFRVYQDLITDTDFLGNGNPEWMMMYGEPHPYPVIAGKVVEELMSVSPGEKWLPEFHEAMKNLIIKIKNTRFSDFNTERRSLDRLCFALSLSRTCALKISRADANVYKAIQLDFETENQYFIDKIRD